MGVMSENIPLTLSINLSSVICIIDMIIQSL